MYKHLDSLCLIINIYDIQNILFVFTIQTLCSLVHNPMINMVPEKHFSKNITVWTQYVFNINFKEKH